MKVFSIENTLDTQLTVAVIIINTIWKLPPSVLTYIYLLQELGLEQVKWYTKVSHAEI